MVRDQRRRCPNCRTVVDGATAVDGSEAFPSPGDVTVCVYCAAVLIFTATGLRLPTFAELEKLAENWDLVRAVHIATLFRAQNARNN